MFTKYVAFVALLSVVCNALQNFVLPGLKWGRCPKLEVQQNFSATDYAGTWYVQMQHNLGMIHGDGDCARERIVYNPLHDTFALHYFQKPWSKDQWKSIVGTGFLENSSQKDGKINTVLHNAGKKLTGNYWVLGTDYNFSSVVYSCKEYGLFHKYSYWLMSRQKNLWNDTLDFISQVQHVLRRDGIDPILSDLFIMVDQTNCKQEEDLS